MRTLQETFNAVIDRGIYSIDHNVYMCVALKRARNRDVITSDECDNAISAIRVYMVDELGSGSYSMAAALVDAGLLHMDECPQWFEQCLAIYRDWDNRPMPAQQETTS